MKIILENHGKPVGFCSPDSLGPRFLCQVAPKTPLWKLRFSQRSNALRRTAALCWGAMGLRFLGLEIGEWFMFMILGHEMLCSFDLFWLLIFIYLDIDVFYTLFESVTCWLLHETCWSTMLAPLRVSSNLNQRTSKGPKCDVHLSMTAVRTTSSGI